MAFRKAVTLQGGEFYVEADSVQAGDEGVDGGSRHEASEKTSWRRWAGGILVQREQGRAGPEAGEGSSARAGIPGAKPEHGVWGAEGAGLRGKVAGSQVCLASEQLAWRRSGSEPFSFPVK